MTSAPALPPGPRAPRAAQHLAWIARPTQLLRHCARRWPEAFTLCPLGQPPIVVLSDPAAIRDIYTGDPDELPAGEAAKVLEPVLGPGSLLLLDGERHRRERKLLMPPFHGERLRAYARVMQESARRALASWPAGQPGAVHPVMQTITLDVILRAVFGLREGRELEDTRALLGRWADRGSSSVGTWLLLLMPTSTPDGPLRRALGISRPREGETRPPPPRWLPWHELAVEQRNVDAALRAQIARRRAAVAAGGDAGDDVLALLLGATDEAGAGLGDGELRDELLTLLVAGHETTATTLSWAVHHLLDHPAALARAREEAAAVVAAGDPLAEAPFLDACVKETLRLTPVVPFVARRLRRPTTLGKWTLPAGVTAAPCIWLTHRRPDLWEDPERWWPERFLEQKIDPYKYFPFGGGARRCLGMAFAALEMRVVLAELLATLELARAPGVRPGTIRRGITLAPRGGVRVSVRPRAGSSPGRAA